MPVRTPAKPPESGCNEEKAQAKTKEQSKPPDKKKVRPRTSSKSTTNTFMPSCPLSCYSFYFIVLSTIRRYIKIQHYKKHFINISTEAVELLGTVKSHSETWALTISQLLHVIQDMKRN